MTGVGSPSPCRPRLLWYPFITYAASLGRPPFRESRPCGDGNDTVLAALRAVATAEPRARGRAVRGTGLRRLYATSPRARLIRGDFTHVDPRSPWYWRHAGFLSPLERHDKQTARNPDVMCIASLAAITDFDLHWLPVAPSLL